MKSAPAALTPMASMMTPLQTPNASKPTSREGTWGVPSEGTGNSSSELRSFQFFSAFKSYKKPSNNKDIHPTITYNWIHREPFGLGLGLIVFEGIFTSGTRPKRGPIAWKKASRMPKAAVQQCLDVDMLWYVWVSEESRQGVLRCSNGSGTISKVVGALFNLYWNISVDNVWTTLGNHSGWNPEINWDVVVTSWRVTIEEWNEFEFIIIEGSLEVKLPTIWTDGKAGGKSQRGEVKKWEEQRRERVRRKKMQVREKVGKTRFTAFFQWFVALDGRK